MLDETNVQRKNAPRDPVGQNPQKHVSEKSLALWLSAIKCFIFCVLSSGLLRGRSSFAYVGHSERSVANWLFHNQSNFTCCRFNDSTHDQVTEPHTLPQFKRQSVPGCSIILNAPPPDPEEMALLISTEQITEESHPNPAPHLTQSSASKPNHIFGATLTRNFWVFSCFYQQNYEHFLFPLQLRKPVGKDAIDILWWD